MAATGTTTRRAVGEADVRGGAEGWRSLAPAMLWTASPVEARRADPLRLPGDIDALCLSRRLAACRRRAFARPAFARRGPVPRHLQGAGRDQHDAVRRQLHARGAAHG